MDFIKGNINEARKEIDKSSKQGKKVIVTAGDSDYNRKILENKKVSVLLFVDFSGKDKLKQRDSGLDHVLCRLAKVNNITIGFDLGFLNEKSDVTMSKKIARLSQNIRLCSKYKNKVEVFNYEKNDLVKLKAFLLSLGMNNKMIKQAF
ncbi:hypothetical protein J4477_03040 [Candidatus Pacearchaeota archaeon]|nr:hypothetical protein [Candidatus Pacearchaeota archaeon]